MAPDSGRPPEERHPAGRPPAARAPAELLRAARALLSKSVAPYSGFRVAAILEDGSATEHPGVNVESASYGLSICAERNALFGALARGASRFIRLAVVSETIRPVYPCGACRQILYEHAPDLTLLLEREDGAVLELALRDLLPRPFLDHRGGR